MKTTFTVLAFLLVLVMGSCGPMYTGYNKYDKDGFMKGWWLVKSDTSCIQIVKYKKGFREGVSKKMFNNGQCAIAHYKHGKLNGTEKIYSNGGHLTSTRIYKNDSLIKETIQSESYMDWKKYRRM